MEYKRLDFIFNLLRYLFIYLYYVLLPIGMMIGVSILKNYFDLVNYTFLLYGIAFLVIMLFYLVNAIILLKKKKMFYDKLGGFQFVSTIKNYDL